MKSASSHYTSFFHDVFKWSNGSFVTFCLSLHLLWITMMALVLSATQVEVSYEYIFVHIVKLTDMKCYFVVVNYSRFLIWATQIYLNIITNLTNFAWVLSSYFIYCRWWSSRKNLVLKLHEWTSSCNTLVILHIYVRPKYLILTSVNCDCIFVKINLYCYIDSPTINLSDKH